MSRSYEKEYQEGDEYDWSTLVAKSVHPTRVAIIEALIRLHRPLSASQIVKMFQREPDLPNFSYHLRALVNLGIVRKAGSRQVRGAVETFYTLR